MTPVLPVLLPRPTCAQQTGAVLVEFALVIPLMLLCVFAIVGFGVALFDKIIIANASREAARTGVRYILDPATGIQTRPSHGEIEARAVALCESLISFGGSPDCSATASSPQGQVKDGPLTVTVTYPYHFLGIGELLNPIGQGPLDLTVSTTMRYE